VFPCLLDWGIILLPTYPTKCAYVEPKVDECKPLNVGSNVRQTVPVSRLDTPAVDGVFGMFYDSYEAGAYIHPLFSST
jgi:hypothetical protein